ncbi:MAG TPA: aminopeptidase [Ramlibacter sp.]|jgi:predicted aminopeptidase
MGLAAVAGLAMAATLCLSGCATLGYYWQSVTGHLGVMNAAKPVDDWVAAPETPARLRDKLLLSQRIRDFAVRELKLPDNPSYRRYADLKRPAAVWNVTAAPPLSLELRTWCFPVTGCVGYRGYYDEAAAKAEAADLSAQGYEANTYPVPAYSTLGMMNWAGGDPLLNTFIQYPEGELARLLFHELAHQVVYVKNDTMFNESFATAVERLGGALWLEQHMSPQARQEYAEFDGRRRQFRELSRRTRDRLKAAYETPGTEPGAKEEAKARIMAEFRAEYAQLRASWPGDPARWRGYDRWVANANNAFFGTQAAYDELVPGFEALFRQVGGDWERFYAAARALEQLPKPERHQRLKEGMGG